MRAAALAALIFVLLSSPATVQNACGQFQLSLGGGASQPVGSFGEETKTGFGLTAGLGYEILSFLVVGAETSFFANQASDEALDALGPGYDLASRIQQISGFAKFQLPVGKHHVYAKGSVGSYLGSAQLTSPSGVVSVRNTDPGFGIGGGFMLNGAQGTAFFAEATYHAVTYDGADEATTFMGYNVGAIFRFGLPI